jgi:hypothetical protein
MGQLAEQNAESRSRHRNFASAGRKKVPQLVKYEGGRKTDNGIGNGYVHCGGSKTGEVDRGREVISRRFSSSSTISTRLAIGEFSTSN